MPRNKYYFSTDLAHVRACARCSGVSAARRSSCPQPPRRALPGHAASHASTPGPGPMCVYVRVCVGMLLSRLLYISACSSCVCSSIQLGSKNGHIHTHTHTSRVFQRARACRNILFGSKNRKTKSSWFLTRAVYFQRARACRNIRFGSKNRKTKSSSVLTRAVYFSELELAEIYGSGQKTGKQNLQVF